MRLRLRTTAWLLFAVFIVYGTTIPFHFIGRLSTVERRLEWIAAHPLTIPGDVNGLSIPDIVQNVLLFVPFGVLGVLAGAPGAGRRRIAFVTVLAAALAIGVEVLQLFMRNRVSSVADAATDTLGAFLGAMAAYELRWASAGALKRLTTAGVFARAFYPMMVALIVVCVAAWVPFDVTLDVGMIVPKLRLLGRDPWQFTAFNDEGVAMIQYALLAVAVCAWLHELGYRNAAAAATVIVVGAAIGLEATQVAITSRMPGLEDAAVHAGSAVLGACLWWMGRHKPRPALWLAVFIAATAAAAVVHTTGTPEIAPTQRLYWLLHLRSYELTAVPALSQVSERLLIYLPAGFFVAHTWVNPRRAVVAALVIAAVIAVPIEYVQGSSAQRFAASIGVSLAGAYFGAWAATRGASMFGRAHGSRQTARMHA